MNKNDFLLPLNGLVHGRTRRDLRVGKEFFESFGNTEILDADLMASVETEKFGSYTGVDCHVSGNVQVACDRCLDPVLIPVETDAMLTVKFGDGDDGENAEDDSSGREVVWLAGEDAVLDMAQVIYDYVCLSLPPRRFHPDGECNQEVMKYLMSGIKVSGGGDVKTESPFASLKDILGGKA